MGNSNLDPMEELLVMKIGMVAAAVAIGSFFTVKTWHKAVDWMLSHKVLASAAEHPVLTLPAAEGAGLDVARLVALVAVLLLLLVLAISGLRAWWAKRDENEGLR